MKEFTGFVHDKSKTAPSFSFESTTFKNSTISKSVSNNLNTKAFNFGSSCKSTPVLDRTCDFSLNSFSNLTSRPSLDNNLQTEKSSDIQNLATNGFCEFPFRKTSSEKGDKDKENSNNNSFTCSFSPSHSSLHNPPAVIMTELKSNTIDPSKDKLFESLNGASSNEIPSNSPIDSTGVTFSIPFSHHNENNEILDTSKLDKDTDKINKSHELSNTGCKFKALTNPCTFAFIDESSKLKKEKPVMTTKLDSNDDTEKLTKSDSKTPSLPTLSKALDLDNPAAPSLSTPNKPKSTTTTRNKVIEPLPEEYYSKTVEQILNSLSSQLESDTVQFLKSAQRVAQYDAMLRDSQRSLSHLTQKVSQLIIHQGDVDRSLTSITSYQHELFNTITYLENQVTELFVAQNHLVAEHSDIEREEAYTIAQGLETKLTYMEKDINSLMDNLNIAQENAFGESDSDCNEGMNLVTAMNQQHNELSNMEERLQLLETEFSKICDA